MIKNSNVSVKLSTDSLNDLAKLPHDLQIECVTMLKKLSDNIDFGLSLEDKNGINLSNCFKLYFNNAKHRIIYRKIDNWSVIDDVNVNLPIAEILGIGKRNNQFIYKLVGSRLGQVSSDKNV